MIMLEPLSPFEYYHILDARRDPSLVCFTKPNCGGCRRLKHLLQEEPLDIPNLRCFEVSVEDAYGLVEEFNIFHLPTMFLYFNGEFHREIHSRLDRPSLQAAISNGLLQPPVED